jgi:hypothetical protein
MLPTPGKIYVIHQSSDKTPTDDYIGMYLYTREHPDKIRLHLKYHFFLMKNKVSRYRADWCCLPEKEDIRAFWSLYELE